MKRPFSFLAVLILPSLAFGCGAFFEEAPPLLPYYLDRLPAKSLGDLYLETKPLPKLPPPDASAIDALPEQVGKTDRKHLIERVNGLLEQARANYENGELCNKLNDLHDALASRGTDAEVADYLKWRLANASAFLVPPPPEGYSELKPPLIADTPFAREIEKRAEAASPEMRAQWLYARGALGFCAGDRVECAKWFERVWKEFPEHPRAEAALFLSARCALRAARDDPWYPNRGSQEGLTAEQKAAEQARQKKQDDALGLFHQYLEKYPHGRLVADAYGWLGALDLQSGNVAAALEDYTRQLETPGHPEVIKSALFMCEEVLSRASANDEALFAFAAQHPLVAMGATYVALQSPEGGEQDTDDGAAGSLTQAATYRYETARAKSWRQQVLPKLAAAVARQKASYEAGAWPARYLAILAQAASAAGQQDQALAISDLPAAQLEASDDLLLARGIAFQRARQPGKAIATYRTLLTKLPRSPLVPGVKLKLALALQDNHQAGLAVLLLKQLGSANNERGYSEEVYPPAYADMAITDSHVWRDITNSEEDQVEQIIDALYNFAPIEELSAALDAKDAIQQYADTLVSGQDVDLLKRELNGVLAQRSLAKEDFASARRYLAAAQSFHPAETSQPPREDQAREERRASSQAARQKALAERLQNLTGRVGAAGSPAQKARAMLELGDAWSAARGKLLVGPIFEADDQLFHSDSDQALERRAVNGHALGFKDVNGVLENWDELRHAARWWMRAARLQPGTSLAAAARLKALESIPQLANGSDYAFLRAVEANAAEVSRELYQRLRSECPTSLEATRKAAYWSFPMHKLRGKNDSFPSFKSLDDREQDSIGKMGYAWSDYGAFGQEHKFDSDEDNGDTDSEEWKPIWASILALKDHAIAGWGAAELAAEIEAIRGKVRALYVTLGQSRYIDLLDDFSLFLREPVLSPETRGAYFGLRVDVYTSKNPERLEEAMQQPALKPVADYVDFLKAVRVSHTPPPDSDSIQTLLEARAQKYQALEKQMRAFLAAYPKSRKREAATLVLARAVHWLTTPYLETWSAKEEEPEPQIAGVTGVAPGLTTNWREKFSYRRAIEPLDAYDHEFPQGRYAADIRNYRGSAALRGHDWPVALDAALAGVNDKTHRELEPESALLLANVFAQLADADSRADLIKAIAQRPEAMKRLQEYLAKTWRYKDHPLRYLGDYLGEQLGFHLSEPPIEEDDLSSR